MEDSSSEDDKLRKQIEFLTQLINDAKSSSNSKEQGAFMVKDEHAAGASVRHSHQPPRPGQSYTRSKSGIPASDSSTRSKSGIPASDSSTRSKSGIAASDSSTLQRGHFSNPVPEQKGNPHSKYSWSKTKGTATDLNRKENAVGNDKPNVHHKPAVVNPGIKSFDDYQHLGFKEKVNAKLELKNSVPYDSKIAHVGKAYWTKSRSMPMPRSTLFSTPQTVKSNSIGPVDGQHQGKPIHQCSQTSSVDVGKSVSSIQQKLLATQKAIQDLKKDLEKRAISASDPTAKSPVKKEQYQSLSPYKLQKVPTGSSSVISPSTSRTCLQTPTVLHDIPSTCDASIKPSHPHIGNIRKQSNSPVIQSNYSFKRESSAPSLSNIHRATNVHKLQTPSKLVHKTRYSLKRERTSSCAKNYSKTSNSSKSAPSKYVNVSRYSLKRIRRSLSDEAKLKKSRLRSENGFGNKNSNTQYAAHVIRSKYKVQKVYKGQHPRTWTSRNGGYPSMYRNNGSQWKARQSGYHSTRARQGGAGSAFFSYRKKFNQKQWKIRQHPFYRGRKQHNFSPQSSHWRRTQSQFLHPSFISQKYVKRKMAWLKQNIPFNPKMKVDRRTNSPQKTAGASPVNMVMVNGLLYKTSRRHPVTPGTAQPRRASLRRDTRWPGIKHASANNMKTISVRGVMFSMDNSGKKLTRVKADSGSTKASSSGGKVPPQHVPVTRVDFGGVTYVQTKPGTLERLVSVQKRRMASRVVNRTVVRAAANQNRRTAKRQYCMFYNRFGKCNKAAACPYIHDPDKVAVCTRFLRGTCKTKGCPFSHKVSKEKMPVCSYFLKGICNKDNCPYRHVNVNRDADICSDFVKGYCPAGEKCKKKHMLVCPEFSRTGKCKNGKQCKLQHQKRKRKASASHGSSKEKVRKQVSTDQESPPPLSAARDGQPAPPDDSHLPFKERKLPAYISLNLKKDLKSSASLSGPSSGQASVDSAAKSKKLQTEAIQIRPQL